MRLSSDANLWGIYPRKFVPKILIPRYSRLLLLVNKDLVNEIKPARVGCRKQLANQFGRRNYDCTGDRRILQLLDGERRGNDWGNNARTRRRMVLEPDRGAYSLQLSCRVSDFLVSDQDFRRE